MSSPPAIQFSSLRINGWRQFAEINLELHPRLTVITGANGSGKSTLLNIFSSHFGYQRPYLSTPLYDGLGGVRYFAGLIESLHKASWPQTNQVGEIAYSNGMKAVAHVPPKEGQIQYNLTITPQQPVQGFLMPSHRRTPVYQRIGQIPTQPILPAQAYANFNGEMTAVFQGGQTQYSPTYRIKEALLSMAVFGPGNALVQPNPILMKTFEGFSETLRKILPEEIGFIAISIRSPDVILETKAGEFLIDAASGGLMALVDLTWQIYMFSLGVSSFVVTLDEPENHLHPSMQRKLMSNLINTFPGVQFIVATHSPFIVSALRDAHVYGLKYEDRADVNAHLGTNCQQTRFVSSIRLDSVNRAGTASQILRDVLGLPTTYPEWVTQSIDDIVARYKDQPFNEELLASLRKELEDSGYGSLYPDVAAKLVKA